MNTERIELEGGAWWRFRTVKTVGMAMAAEKVARDAIKARNMEEALTDPDNQKLDVYVDMAVVDLYAITREMLYAATTEWSYGEVTREVFENEIPYTDYEAVAGRFNELFGSSPLSHVSNSESVSN